MEMDPDSRTCLYDSFYHWIVSFLVFGGYRRFAVQQGLGGGPLATSATQRSLEFYINYGRNHGPVNHDVLLFLPV